MTAASLSLRVLYLEDNPVDADLTRRKVARLAPKMRLEVVTTLAEAMVRLAPTCPPYDVVLADLCLPDGSGMDLLAHVRERELPLAVVIITGSGDQEAAVAALKAGADDYLVKRTGHADSLPQMLSAARARFQENLERRSRHLRVLYAEPNAPDADLTHRYFAQHAPHIRLKDVTSGEEVLARLPLTTGAGKPFDVLLLDYRLPGLNALEVIKELRQERGLEIPIMLVTGHGNEGLALQALRLGVDEYLVKHEGYLQQLPALLEKMQKQAELNASEERYRSLFENNQAVMLVIDPATGEIVDANPAAAAWYGWSREELCRKNISEINMLSLDELRAEIERACSRQGCHFSFQHRRADGSVRDVEVFSGQVTVASRPLLYSIIQDITEKKLAEEALKKKNAEIEQFFYTVSHDLRSPLVTVKTFMGYLEKDITEGNQDQLAQDIYFIHSAADKMKLLLDELLEMYRIGRIDNPPVRASLMDIITEVLDSLAGVITEGKADIQRPDSDLMLFGDRPRFCQIWQNLIENAIQFSRKGSIPRIELGVQQMGGETVFFVTDNGIGVDPQFHGKIFGIFEKLNPKSPGAGLGLSMIQRIVEKCGGRVWVESEGKDKGSCFRFTLPEAFKGC